MVEGLKVDYLELLRPYFTADGFRVLMDNGVTIENVDFGPGVDHTAAVAMLMSGTSPVLNGIPSATTYDLAHKVSRPILLDPSKVGSYTPAAFTPASLLVSTLPDEVRITDGGIGSVHAIAGDPQTAIIMAGHAGNSAYWIDDVTGNWASSVYYKDSPQPVTKRNYVGKLSTRIDTLSWTPSMPVNDYPDLPEYKRTYPFRHTFPSRDPDRYKSFKVSACGNREIAATAIDYITMLGLGKKDVTDMLNIGFTLTPYAYTREADNRIETMDAYLRLDSDLAAIFKAIEKGPGMANTLIFVAGTPSATASKRDDDNWQIPYGRFSPRKATSLLNMYLIARYGNGDYVAGYYNNYLYLNETTLRDHQLDPAAIRAEAAQFLTRMSGVADVFTIDQIIASRAGDDGAGLRRNTYPPVAGDILILVNPGWEITDLDPDDPSAAHTRGPVVRNIPAISTAIIMAPGVEASTITATIDARALAPTIARLLRIRSPNAASTPSLRLK